MDAANTLTGLLSDLISFKSDEEEREIAEYIGERLRKKGFNVEIQPLLSNQKRANMIAKLGNPTGKRILFQGHLDVVPAGNEWTVPPFKGTVKDGKVFGRGAADMKGGLASIILAAEQLASEPALLEKNEIILCFVCDEERQCQGIKRYLSSSAFAGADYAVIAEPTDLKICTCHRGSCHYKIRVYGSGSHAARPQMGVNAIEKVMKVLDAIEEYSNGLKTQLHEFLDPEVITPTMIRAGIQDNMIPDMCEIVVDMRMFPGKNAESAISPLSTLLDQIAAEDSSFSYDIQIIQEALGGELSKTAPLVEAASFVYHDVFSCPASLKGFDVTCEQSYLLGAGIPTIIFGPGDCGLAHTPDENVEIKALQNACQYFYKLAKYLLRQ